MKKIVIVTFVITLLLAGTLFATSATATPRLKTTVWRSFDMDRSSCLSYFSVLTTDMNAICVLAGVRGDFEGGGEYGYVQIENGAWVFRGRSCQNSIKFWVRCFKYYP